jgi:prepilin-type N-terminal cleavage/methylation domain-containing protein/prepilin-type processing-associated H-X9-DG protein
LNCFDIKTSTAPARRNRVHFADEQIGNVISGLLPTHPWEWVIADIHRQSEWIAANPAVYRSRFHRIMRGPEMRKSSKTLRVDYWFLQNFQFKSIEVPVEGIPKCRNGAMGGPSDGNCVPDIGFMKMSIHRKITVRNTRSHAARRGFSLVELLVVIAIIGVLIALLLPAIQAARESARRAQCSNNLKQIGLAMLNYESAHRSLPTGILRVGDLAQGMGWSAYLLPFLEEQNLYDSLGFTEFNQFANPPPGSPGVYDSYNTNGPATETYLNVFRCPSAAIREHVYDISEGDGWTLFKRVPACYIAGASGKIVDEGAASNYLSKADGAVYSASYTRLKHITDGTTCTLLVGEALPEDFPVVPGMSKSLVQGIKDHWYIGGDDPDKAEGWDGSEFLGSTAVPINVAKGQTGYELSFSSPHAGGCQIVLCDGSVRFVADAIDPLTWSLIGSRADGKIIDEF